jgi:hypothetical protein
MPLSASIRHRLAFQHLTVFELSDVVDPSRLKLQINPGKWSVRENIVHLTAYQNTFIQRLGLIESENAPLFERYIAENDPRFHECLEWSDEKLKEIFLGERAQINVILNELNEDQLLRTAKHSKFGLLSVVDWTEFFLLHESHHLFTIFQLVHAGS